jgi:hypothetical protein
MARMSSIGEYYIYSNNDGEGPNGAKTKKKIF